MSDIQPATSSVDEIRLIQRIKDGEVHLLHELILPYERAIYLLAYSVLRKREDAEEVAQETVLKILTHIKQLRADDKLKSWILRIAMNEARMRRRHEHGHLFEPLESDNHAGEFMPRDFADWREIPSETLERGEICNAVERALGALPPSYREVIVLRDIQGLDARETAEILGTTTASVKVRLHRARLRMREQLAPLFRRRWRDRLALLRGVKPW